MSINRLTSGQFFTALMAGFLFIFAGCTNTADKVSSAQSSQATGQHAQVQHKKPNIILVFLDDAGYGAFGITGSSTPTPTIDALATNGVQFTQFYEASPVCSASREVHVEKHNY